MGRDDDDDDDDDDEPTGIESGVIDILLSWSSPCELEPKRETRAIKPLRPVSNVFQGRMPSVEK